MVLHTLACTPSSTSLGDCLRCVTAEDAVLLLGDGVYCALDSRARDQLSRCGASIYALINDAEAAGVNIDATPFTPATMDDFVALTEAYPRSLAWY